MSAKIYAFTYKENGLEMKVEQQFDSDITQTEPTQSLSKKTSIALEVHTQARLKNTSLAIQVWSTTDPSPPLPSPSLSR